MVILENSGLICFAILHQGAIPKILQDTTEQFFSSTNSILKEASEKCFSKVNEIPCIACPHKPQGSMFVMVKLEVSLLEDIKDDMDFCLKLAKEESVVVLPGIVFPEFLSAAKIHRENSCSLAHRFLFVSMNALLLTFTEGAGLLPRLTGGLLTTRLILAGAVVGMKNWLRVTFAVEPPCLEDGLERIKAFCCRHSVTR